MAAVYPAETYRSRTWPAAKALLAHAYAAARHSEAFDVGRPHRADVLERVCIFEYEHGRMSEAADAGRRSLRAAERHRVGDWKLADILVNYASALGGLERWLEAESHFQRAIELERGNPERLAKTLNIYGDLLRKAGRPEEALEQHAEALRCAEGHPQILAEILHDQSLAFSTTRDYEKALEVLRRAENLVESGTETELLIDTRIAATLNDLERHADALAAIDRALPRIEKMWGGRSWPYVVAWHQRGIALDALAAQSGDPKLRKAAMAEYLRYRDVRDQLEAQPEGAAGAVVDV
jgi:tetratricopeptide (TPR) repeat protein